MNDPITRAATSADETAILALIEELFEPPGARARGYSEERGKRGMRWALEQPNADILVAESDGRLLGLASVYADIESIRYGRRCWLQDLIVTKEARSLGVGRRLLDAATDWAREHGCTHLQLSSGTGRAEAHRFYIREGMSQGYNFERWIGDDSR